ncbi:related to transcriptional activator Mut3p [Fusarium fujikuroi]|nr:related to transcriptional activator Mut3p [Fusarium fujikuroi]
MNNRGDRRRRLAKACDHCRKGKVRCDGTRPVCGRCRGCGNDCHYADVDKPDPRQRRSKISSRSSTGDTIDGVCLQGVNASSTLLSDSVVVQTVPHPQQHVEAHHELHSFTQSSPGQTLTATDTSPRDTIVGGNEDMRYFGPPSGISLVSTATPRKSGQHTPESWSKWTHPSIEPLFTKRVMKPLPSWTEAFSLVSEFFTHEHQVFPCFNAPAFMCLLGQQYSGTYTESPAWWVSLNSVFALAQRRRAEAAQSAEAEDLAWAYASNALAGTWDVLMRSTQLSSVQALLAIAWFFIGTPNPQPSFMLVGCAVRLAHSIGIHVESQDPSVSPAEGSMRKKVFWIAICLDRELCLRTGRPPCHDLNAAYVDPPMGSLDETEIVKTVEGYELNLFKGQIQLAVIQSAIYQDLHSGKGPTNCVTDTAADLLQRLENWRTEFAPSLTHDSAGKCEHHGLMRLYFSYYNAVIVVSRAHSLTYWVSPNHPEISALPAKMRDTIGNCLNASRCIIELSKLIPVTWKSFHWDIIPIPMSAVVILCIMAIRNPMNEAAANDMRLVGDVMQIFKILDEAYGGNTYLTQVQKVCQELYRKAHYAVQSLNAQLVDSIDIESPALQPTSNANQQEIHQTHQTDSMFEFNLDTFEQTMPYPVPMLWDLDTSLWASII